MKVTDDGDKLIIDTAKPRPTTVEAPALNPSAKPFKHYGNGPCAACAQASTSLDERTKLCVACWRAWRFGSRF